MTETDSQFTGTAGLSLRNYLEIVVGRIEQAGERGDKPEAIRLLRIMAEVAEEEARKLEKLR